MNQNDAIPEFLIQILDEQYGKETTKKIIEGYSCKRPVTLRVNTLKTTIDAVKEKLEKLKIQFKEVAWSKEALILENVREPEIEKLSIYENGEIYLQSLSSMLPPIILQPQKGGDILDMAAAPGGKTTQIASLTNNEAHITACELNAIRAERLKYNIEKQGASSVYVMVKDARNLDDFFSFSQILLDAPCSGSGTLEIDNPKLKQYFTRKIDKQINCITTCIIKKSNQNIETRM